MKTCPKCGTEYEDGHACMVIRLQTIPCHICGGRGYHGGGYHDKAAMFSCFRPCIHCEGFGKLVIVEHSGANDA